VYLNHLDALFLYQKKESSHSLKKECGLSFCFFVVFAKCGKKITSAIPTGNTCLKKSNIAFLIFGNAKNSFVKNM